MQTGTGQLLESLPRASFSEAFLGSTYGCRVGGMYICASSLCCSRFRAVRRACLGFECGPHGLPLTLLELVQPAPYEVLLVVGRVFTSSFYSEDEFRHGHQALQ